MKNFSELKNNVAVLLERSGDADYLSKIGVWLNLGQDFLLDIYDYWIECQNTYNFSTADGTESYPMPNDFEKPLRVTDLTNKKGIIPISEEEYTDNNISDIAAATEGNPEYYRLSGISGSRVQVSTSGKTLQAKSSSASDTNITVRIEGYIDSAMLIIDYEEIVVTGTAYVAGTKTFYKLTRLSKSGDSVGYITIADSASTILEYLAPTERVARHKVMKFGLIPDGIHSMRILYKKRFLPMVDDYDYPFTECDNFLILDSWAWGLSQSKESAQYAGVIWSKAKVAMDALLVREMGKLGPEYQNKIVSKWLESHRL